MAVLGEATRLASRVGLGGLTIGTLAEQAQLSKSGLFAHFRSKESLQLQVLEHAIAQFVDLVIRPVMDAPRGEARVRELFDRWLRWSETLPGGCLFIAAMTELDDQPGPVRDRFVRAQRDWMDVIEQVFRTGVAEVDFAEGADPAQFAQDLYGVLLGYHHASRLLEDQQAEARAYRAFEALLGTARGAQ